MRCLVCLFVWTLLIGTAYAGFVRTNNKAFTLDGLPWYCSGTNAYYAALKYIMPESELDVMMRAHANEGINVMRIFAHSNFDSVPDAMMPTFGQYNEESIRRLDLVIEAARKYDIKLILVLGNYWPYTGGIQAWVDKAMGYGKSLNLFYTDETLKNHYKDWVRHVVTRRNSMSGLAYSDDPTIMAWELLNEPRLQTGTPPEKIICDWVWDMAAFIKSLDANHLVCTGEEGFLADPNATEPHAWINNGHDGIDFRCNIQSPNIDFATIHTYPDQWGMSPPDGYVWLAENFIKHRAEIAHALGKPIILEEYGQGKEYYGPRDTLMEWLHQRADENRFACTLIWAVSHRGTDGTMYGRDDQGYVFVYGDDGTLALKIQVVRMKINAVKDTIADLLKSEKKV
jgi:mannan endo-1,4-beta-mannosidase